MKHLVFIGSDNIGDAFLTYQVLDAISYGVPDISIHLYHKNHFQTRAFFENHPNIKSLDIIITKVKIRTLISSTKKLYKDILSLLSDGDVCISSLLGSGTINLLIQPLLFWNKLFGKNKIIPLAMKPLLNGGVSQHILQFHYGVFSKALGVNIEGKTKYSLLKPQTVERKTIAIVAGASGIWKCLPVQTFVGVISHFLKKGYEIKLLGGKGKVDISQSEAIIQHFQNESKVKNLVGKTTLFEYFSEIQKTEYIITNDSSAQHIAFAGNKPCAVIWGRNINDQVVQAYSYKNANILNIFNQPYIYIPLQKILVLLTGRYLGRSKKSMVLNYNAFTAENICSAVEEHMNSIIKTS